MAAPGNRRAARATARIPAPARLRAALVSVGGEELLHLEWPLALPRWPLSLTPAQREVAALLLSGLTNAEIAGRRGTAVRTVANQVASVFERLGVRSRLELFARAARSTRPGGAT